jgi:protein-tyrosine phosphatase
MIKSILVVCVGNVCRSPLGEYLLKQRLPSVQISSAGLGALVGNPADEDASAVASARGVSLEGHVARQFEMEVAGQHDLILVMEPRHKQEIAARAPQLLGRVMLFDQWTGGKGVSDPYRRSREFHQAIFEQMSEAADAWARRLGQNAR